MNILLGLLINAAALWCAARFIDGISYSGSWPGLVGLALVFAVVNQSAQLRLVKTGKRIGDQVEILSGLDAGDAVIVDGPTQLIDGQPVEAK